MRIVALLMLVGAAWTATSPAGDASGVWKANSIRSANPYPDSLVVRFEPHAKGEVFTMDRVDGEGRAITSSSMLYLDGQPRDLQDVGCSGSQSSRRVDSRTVEILRTCAGGERTRIVRRLAAQPKELILEITEQHPDGSRLERRVVLEKQ